MSAEVGLLTAFGKYLWLPLIALLGWFFKQTVGRLEGDIEKASNKDDLIIQRISQLENELNRNYYDKQEIKEHIVDPLTKRMDSTDASLKSLTGMMTELIQDIGILKYALLEDEVKKNK